MKTKKKIILRKRECKNCRYVWFPIVEKPKQCPNCKRQIKYEKKL